LGSANTRPAFQRSHGLRAGRRSAAALAKGSRLQELLEVYGQAV
jgi:hypothetical protein